MADEPQRTDPIITNSIGKGDQKSRAKAQTAHERTAQQRETANSDGWPTGSTGEPMMKITMTASELIPTGQYANVSIGPAQITAFVDTKRAIEPGKPYFGEAERQVMAQALNEMAEIVEGDVIAVQRNLVLASMQQQIGK